MTIIGVDPGTEQSAMVLLKDDAIWQHAIVANEAMLDWICGDFTTLPDAVLVLEKIESQGMAVGKETFLTVFWAGRFAQAWSSRQLRFEQVTRRQVKLHLCQSMRATDANIRQAIIDRYALTKAEAIGTKKTPGPLYGIRSHEWSALSVGLTWGDQQQRPL